ncbi:MAG TPA: isoprenylcysteine carboxylmethyltransferase family protein [Cyclobacteriaceae bacterium]|nr:isoprenylcysteine carboxylmethyltransferase family protein [Cyclobacteriaceae bacterium]
MISLLIRNLFFTILLPGFTAGVVPYWVLGGKIKIFTPLTALQISGLFLLVPGLAILFHCIYRFAVEGRGTLAPFDPTRKLVVGGLYKYSRNPMYIGVIAILAGESMLYMSGNLGIYTLIIFAAFNIFIMIVEEPRLRRDFGKEYEGYCRRVRRWL